MPELIYLTLQELRDLEEKGKLRLIHKQDMEASALENITVENLLGPTIEKIAEHVGSNTVCTGGIYFL